MKAFSFLLFLTFFTPCMVLAQSSIRGTVVDYFNRRPLEGVSVRTTSGNATFTDSSGVFRINVSSTDSLFFSYFSKNTKKYPVDTIRDPGNFEIALYVDAQWLPEVKIKNTDYTLDSIRNREAYAKIFNYKKPGVELSTSSGSYTPGSVTVGINLDELINMFRFKRNRQLQSFQNRLVQQEQDKYVTHRFTKYFVGRLTDLKGADLDSFMNLTRPSYELLIQMNELELGYYIQKCYELYKQKIITDDLPIKKEEP